MFPANPENPHVTCGVWSLKCFVTSANKLLHFKVQMIIVFFMPLISFPVSAVRQEVNFKKDTVIQITMPKCIYIYLYNPLYAVWVVRLPFYVHTYISEFTGRCTQSHEKVIYIYIYIIHMCKSVVHVLLITSMAVMQCIVLLNTHTCCLHCMHCPKARTSRFPSH